MILTDEGGASLEKLREYDVLTDFLFLILINDIESMRSLCYKGSFDWLAAAKV